MLKSNFLLLPCCAIAVSLLAACGGGGGGTGTEVTYNTGFTQPIITDTYSGSWSGFGNGFGGDSGGSADSAGGAGDGEFVQLTGGLPTGTNTSVLSWKVLRSQYGQQNTTGTLTVKRNTDSSGGYTVVAVNGSASAVRATQSNIFVSASGIVTGTLPLTIAGTVRDTSINAMRLLDSATATNDFSPVAGTYAYGYFNAEVGTNNNRKADGGWMRVNADGTGRTCDGASSYSATCANGRDIVTTYDSANKSILHVKHAATQSLPIAANFHDSLDVLMVIKPVTINGVAGYALSGDVLSWDSRTPAAPQRTGIVYASRMYDLSGNNAITLSSSYLTGAYNITMLNVTTGKSGYFFGALADVSGVVKGRASVDTANPLSCDNDLGNEIIFPASTTNGVFYATGNGNANYINHAVYIDSDSFMLIPNDSSSLSIARRFSNVPTDTPVASCQPV
jgi:hypothetical protein